MSAVLILAVRQDRTTEGVLPCSVKEREGYMYLPVPEYWDCHHILDWLRGTQDFILVGRNPRIEGS